MLLLWFWLRYLRGKICLSLLKSFEWNRSIEMENRIKERKVYKNKLKSRKFFDFGWIFFSWYITITLLCKFYVNARLISENLNKFCSQEDRSFEVEKKKVYYSYLGKAKNYYKQSWSNRTCNIEKLSMRCCRELKTKILFWRLISGKVEKCRKNLLFKFEFSEFYEIPVIST